MQPYFELAMHNDGRYVFTARDAAGELLVTSARYLTRQSALEGMRCILQACAGTRGVCFDRTLHAWRLLSP